MKKCLIHYDHIAIADENSFVEVNEERHKRLLAAREARRNLGGSHLHSDQCNTVPDNFTIGNHYHRECYNNFSRAVSEWKKEEQRRKNIEPIAPQTSRSQRSKETDTAGRFPEYNTRLESVFKGGIHF